MRKLQNEGECYFKSQFGTVRDCRRFTGAMNHLQRASLTSSEFEPDIRGTPETVKKMSGEIWTTKSSKGLPNGGVPRGNDPVTRLRHEHA
jgi:hypothetical protein